MFTALIVGNNPIFRQSLKELLNSRYPHVRVKEAADGPKALRIIGRGAPDLIFMDIRLPGKSGLDITTVIKRDNPGIPVIILADYDFVEYRDAACRSGADFFIPEGSAMAEEIIPVIDTVLLKDPVLSPDPRAKDP